ncbi:MAG TPA: putative quinol monooxygenase [Actinomycetes bacterium]|nr:putative quinol monooxygenase [Actinomycetes bacterium]
MYALIVSLRVKPGMVDQFVEAIGENSRASRREEPGCLRFDVHRDVDDPNHFLLYELYADERAFTEAHRGAPHYQKWRSAVAELLEPGGQVNTFATPVFPADLPEAGR